MLFTSASEKKHEIEPKLVLSKLTVQKGSCLDDKVYYVIAGMFMALFLCVQDFHDEHAWQAFRRLDKGNTGSITPKDFEEIMLSLKAYLLTPLTRENLITVR